MTVQQRIDFFNFIRDIPYKIALNENEQDYCCSTKSIMLGYLLESIGLQTRQVCCQFSWTQTPLPSDILALPFDEAETTHQFLEVLIPETGEWVDIDPTWDAALAGLGFPMAEWDGLTGTTLAVLPTHRMSEAEKRAMYAKYSSPAVMNAYIDGHKEFFTAMNRHFAKVRIAS